MNHTRTDPVAARVHRAQAEKHYQAAERFRRLGMFHSEREALAAARWEDSTAELLETGQERRSA
jgi:hypothetical protein